MLSSEIDTPRTGNPTLAPRMTLGVRQHAPSSSVPVMNTPNRLAGNPVTPTPIYAPEIPVPTLDALGEATEADLSMILSIMKGTVAATGQEFFQQLCRHLASAIGMRWAAVTELLPSGRNVRTIAFCDKDEFLPNFEYPIAHTPCEEVIDGRFCLYPTRVADTFPDHHEIRDFGIDSYMGVPLVDRTGRCLGHLYVMDDKPIPAEPRSLLVFRIFASRATSELIRERAHRALEESEERFRAIIDASMDAILAFEEDLTLVAFNAVAERTLGIPAETAIGTTLRRFLSHELARQVDGFVQLPGADSTHATLPHGLRALRAGGSPFPVEGTLSRVQAEGNPLFTITLRDVESTQRDKTRIDELARENTYLRQEAEQDRRFQEIVGSSPALERVLENVRLVAPTDSTVLIQGETGTGKELIARSLHRLSSRRDGPFVRVNCAALPAGLVESEFFGHERGAFTGAVATRAGRFELASGGTIFLDEIGEISPDVQVKLLRVLQESEFERVGGNKTVRVNVRVLAATNRNLSHEVEAGRFRADLYYRLSVFPIDVPPLRAREGDVCLLVGHFVEELSRSMGKSIRSVDPDTMTRLAEYAWPGNIRELRNVIERAVILCAGSVLAIPPEALCGVSHSPRAHPRAEAAEPPLALEQPAIGAAPGGATRLEDIEREHIRAVLARTQGAVAGAGGAAALLGIPPSTLRSRMAKLGIRAK